MHLLCFFEYRGGWGGGGGGGEKHFILGGRSTCDSYGNITGDRASGGGPIGNKKRERSTVQRGKWVSRREDGKSGGKSRVRVGRARTEIVGLRWKDFKRKKTEAKNGALQVGGGGGG